MYWLVWTIAIGVYMTICLFAIYMTCREHQTNKHRNLILIGISYLLCLAWPLVVITMFAFALWRPAEFTLAEEC